MGDVSEEGYTDAMDALRDAACDAFSGDDHHPGFFRIVNAADRLQAAAIAEGRRMEREAVLRYLEQASGGTGEWYDGFRTAIMRMRNDIRNGEHEKGEDK